MATLVLHALPGSFGRLRWHFRNLLQYIGAPSASTPMGTMQTCVKPSPTFACRRRRLTMPQASLFSVFFLGVLSPIDIWSIFA